MAWVRFIICLLLGYMGVHKFMEKKTKMGFLYLFTAGLFGFGWLYDCCKYLIAAIKVRNTKTHREEPSEIFNTNVPQATKKNIKNVLLWVLTVFFALIALVYLTSGGILAGLLAVAFVVLVIPIESWQTKIRTFIKGKWKAAVAAVLAVLCFMTVPTPEAEDTMGAISTVTTEATEPTELPTELPTEAPTEAPTEPPTEAPTEAPTEPPTEAPTEAPTEPPTEAPTEPPHVHSFEPATCNTPKTCYCGATEGSSNGHDWKNATCSEPKKCTVCGTTSGLTAGHNFSNGECIMCGKEDPDVARETMVWIPTKGGTKYHTHAGCSNMDDPEQVTISEAESRGFTPCKRCH